MTLTKYSPLNKIKKTVNIIKIKIIRLTTIIGSLAEIQNLYLKEKAGTSEGSA